MNPTATTSKKVRLFPPQLPPHCNRGGHTSPVAASGVKTAQQGKTDMIKHASIKIPFVLWRNDQPRYVPSPLHRALGYKGRDLKLPNGTWFTVKEAMAESLRIQAEVSARKANPQHTIKRQAITGLGRTLSEINAALFDLPEYQGQPIVDGKRIRKPLSIFTVQGYARYARLVERACARLDDDDTWNMPVAMIGPHRMQSLITEIERHSGLQQARKARGFLSAMWSRLAAKEPGALKGLFLELEKMPTPEGRIRPWEPHEFWAMVTTAESMGRYDMADSFFWAVLHGDRQTDRIDPKVLVRTTSHITLKHSKTGRETTKVMDPWLQARFAANAKRRESHKVHWPQLIIDEQAKRPWAASGNHYAHVFAAIRKQAVTTCPTLLDGPHGLGIRDQDLRDTNQTWLDRASVDPRTMQMIAGHATGEKSQLQKRHYVAANQDRMDKAVMAISAILTQTAPKTTQEIEG